MSEPGGAERAPAEVAANIFQGPAAVQQGSHNTQNNFFGPDHEALRARWLQAYLSAARRAGHDRRYPGVLPETTPPLSAVHVRQQATPISAVPQQGSEEGAAASENLRGALPADEVLAAGESCVILAGPGGGKSSLLLARLADGVSRWLAGQDDNAVPVLVPAEALASAPVADALAAFLSKDMSGLAEALPSAFFSAPPSPGARWLLLVDGLDEITDSTVRRKVLDRLKATDGPHVDLYRFVLATRPLPQGEIDVLGSWVPRYELQPFTFEDLPRVARLWFDHLSDPDSVTERFIHAVSRTRLTELTRIPLMASLLCQLHADAPDQDLPTSRGQIYRDFIALLHKRQHVSSSPDNPGRLRAGLDAYGTDALQRAEELLDRLPDLISHLAAERGRGNDHPALDIVESQPHAQRPARVPPDEWRAFLGNSLLHSGLLTVRAGDYAFLHQTLLEYLAARHATRDRPARAQALNDLFTTNRFRPWYWSAMPWNESYVGFLLEAADINAPDVIEVLRRLVRRGKGPAGMFLAKQARLGTPLPTEIARAAVDALRQNSFVLIGGGEAIGSSEAIVWLSGGGDHDVLFSRASVGHPTTRVPAAEELIRLGDERGADLLVDIACDVEHLPADRGLAARALIRLGDERGADLLADILQSQQAWLRDRLHAQAAPPVKLWRWVKRTLTRPPHEPPENPARLRGADHPETLLIRHEIAQAIGEEGDPDAAATALETLLGDLVRVMGLDHPHTLTARNNLAHFRGMAGDAAAAAAAFEGLVADRERVLGPDHLETLIARSNLAHWRRDSGDAVGAAAALEHLLSDMVRVLGEDHPETLYNRYDHASWRKEAGDVDGAISAVEQLQQDIARVMGPDHPQTLHIQRDLARWRGEAAGSSAS
ncbi:NACHT domain-containing protein [Streptomyces sp. SD15]